MMTEFWSYSTFITIASITVITGIYISAIKNKFPKIPLLLILLSASIASFVGARLLYVFTSKSLYQGDYSNFFDLEFHGFSLFGGLAFALIISWTLTKIFKINTSKLADLSAPYVGIGIAIIRIGCFIRGCCFGKETNLFLGINPGIFSPAHFYQLKNGSNQLFTVNPIHPTQIYEILAALTGSFIAFNLIKRKLKNGITSLVFVIWFTTLRWIIHYFRVESETFNMSSNFYPIIYLMIISSSILILRRINRSKVKI